MVSFVVLLGKAADVHLTIHPDNRLNTPAAFTEAARRQPPKTPENKKTGITRISTAPSGSNSPCYARTSPIQDWSRQTFLKLACLKKIPNLKSSGRIFSQQSLEPFAKFLKLAGFEGTPRFLQHPNCFLHRRAILASRATINQNAITERLARGLAVPNYLEENLPLILHPFA